jgi:F-type H+-transporting ATPase subunit a
MFNSRIFFAVVDPLDQFSVYPLFTINLGFMTIVVTNVVYAIFLTVVFIAACYFIFKDISKKNGKYLSSPMEFFIALIIKLNSLSDNLKGKNLVYLSFVQGLFFTIAIVNALSLVPFSYALTAQYTVTFALVLSVFLGALIVGIRRNGLKIFNIFLPKGTSFWLSFLLVTVEFISFVSKPISLSLRLCINMLAGHVLVELLVTLIHMLFLVPNYFIIGYIPVIITSFVLALEIMVCVVQAFVFSVLFCAYLDEMVNMH